MDWSSLWAVLGGLLFFVGLFVCLLACWLVSSGEFIFQVVLVVLFCFRGVVERLFVGACIKNI